MHLIMQNTHDNSGNATLWIAVLLEVLRNGGEYGRWQSHVEDSVLLLATLLKLLQMLLEFLERFVLVVLATNVRTYFGELFQLLFHILGWCLDVRLDSLEELLVIHLRSGISDDLDVLW